MSGDYDPYEDVKGILEVEVNGIIIFQSDAIITPEENLIIDYI